MGRIWLVVTLVAGLFAGPFIAEGIRALVQDGPTWFPYLMVLVIAAVALLAGEITRGFSWGLAAGIITFAALAAWAPGTIEFLGLEIGPPF